MPPGNPWLDIPIDDYVGHMSSADVGQHPVLNRLLQEAYVEVKRTEPLLSGKAFEVFRFRRPE